VGVLRLTATLAAPVVLTDELHLDGVLASAHPMCRAAPVSRDTPAAALVHPPLPVAQPCVARVRAALCTAAIFPEGARLSGEQTVRRRDAEDHEALARPLSLGVGPGKNRLMRLPTIVAPSVSWYAVGSRREILRLVRRRVLYVGSWRSAGYGQVTAWEAEYVEVDPTVVLVDAAGVAQRHLPAEWVAWAEAVVTGPLRPPYWHPARQTAAIVRAGTRCELLPGVVEVVRALAQPDAIRRHRERKDVARAARRARPNGGDSPEVGPRAADDRDLAPRV
jgi:hypothetical protein